MPDSSRSGQPSGRAAATFPSDRSREAAPGACASTIRAANASHSSQPRSRGAREPAAHGITEPEPQVLHAARDPRLPLGRALRRRLGIAHRLAGLRARAARAERPSSHSATHDGGSPSPTPPSARSSKSASACLHGIFRLGQEHLNAGPSASTATS